MHLKYQTKLTFLMFYFQLSFASACRQSISKPPRPIIDHPDIDKPVWPNELMHPFGIPPLTSISNLHFNVKCKGNQWFDNVRVSFLRLKCLMKVFKAVKKLP